MSRSFKNITSVLLILCMAFTAFAAVPSQTFAAVINDGSVGIQSGTTGDCTWTLDNNGVLTISGNGEMGYYSWDYMGQNPPPWGSSGVLTVVIEEGVTNIGTYAFWECEKMTQITVPDSVTEIGYYAFRGCSALTNINGARNVEEAVDTGIEGTPWYKNQPEGMVYLGGLAYKYKGTCPESISLKNDTIGVNRNAFEQQTELKTIFLPDSVVSIGWYAFSGCTSLTGINIPDSVVSIGWYAFSGCTSLTGVNIPDSVTDLRCAFQGCTSLTGINIPDGVTDISGAFSGCTSLTGINIPDGVTNSSSAFSGCTSLTEVFISDGVTNIGNNAFSGCTGITEIKIPDSVTDIGGYAFEGCTSLSIINGAKNVSHLESNAFDNTAWKNNLPQGLVYVGKTVYKYVGECPESVTVKDGTNYICQSAFSNQALLKHVDIPDSVTEIRESAFSGCTGLTDIELPTGLTVINDGVFAGCTGLTEVTIPNGVTTIGVKAFSGCTGLTDIELPTGLTRINDEGFSGCTGLTEVTIPNGVTTIGEKAFSGYRLEKITIPPSLSCVMDGSVSCKNIYISDLVEFVKIKYQGYRQEFDEWQWHDVLSDIPPNLGADNLFLNNQLVTDLVLPEEYNSAAYNPFSGFSCFNTITIPDSITKEIDGFNGNTNLTSVTIGNGVTAIGEKAFYGCTGLKELSFGENITELGENAFDGTEWNNNLPGGLTYVGRIAYKYVPTGSPENVIIKEGTVKICDKVFYYCTDLIGVTVPGSVWVIPDHEFEGCTELKSLTVCEGVGSIGYAAFRYCDKLENVVLPKSVGYIGNYAFEYSDVKDLLIKGDVFIGQEAFCGCYKLENVIFAEDGDTLCTESFWEPFRYCNNVTLYCFPDSNVKRVAQIIGKSYELLESECPHCHAGLSPANVTFVLGEAPPSCTEEGVSFGMTCTSCGQAVREQQVIPPGHKPKTDAAIAPSCTKEGRTDGSHCTRCGETIVEQEVIPALGHDTVVFPGRAATHTHIGKTESEKCSRCGKWVRELQWLPRIRDEIITGDVNGDGRVSIRDCTELQRFIADYTEEDGTPAIIPWNDEGDYRASDVDSNGWIDINDVTRIQMYVAEEIEKFDLY